jgi:NAD(P)-dependent dehydrogenase (short-subunit alcohol dehydrogenase family)
MTVQYDFSGKTVFITGSAAGIGRATALAFARAGARVAVVDRSHMVQETVSLITSAGGRAAAIRCDVSQERDVKAAITEAEAAFGGIDFAFNNAGIEQPLTPAADISTEDWQRLVSVNLSGVFFCMKHQIPLMLKGGGGVIVNTASGAGVKGIAGQAAYCATKFGIIGLTKAAALDYADKGIRVNVVSPGIIATPMMDRFSGGTEEGRQRVIAQEPVGRMGRPEEIAATVLWLCSDPAAFIVGSNIVVDGGQTA